MLLAQWSAVFADWQSSAEVGGHEAPDSHELWESSGRPAVLGLCHVCDQGRGDLRPWQTEQPHSMPQPSWVLQTCRGGTSPSRAQPRPLGLLCDWRRNNLCCWRGSEEGVGHPSRSRNFHRSLGMSGRIAACSSSGSGQIVVCEHDGGRHGPLRI